VASVEASDIIGIPIPATFTKDGKTVNHEIAYRPGNINFSPDMVNVPIHVLSLNSSVLDDACSALSQNTPDLSGSIVLIRLSEACSDYEQAEILAPHNPKGVMWYLNPAVNVLNPWSSFNYPVGVITEQAGKTIIETIAAGGKVSLSFPETDRYVVMPYVYGGIGSFWSSWGGLWDLTLKPEIAAVSLLSQTDGELASGTKTYTNSKI